MNNKKQIFAVVASAVITVFSVVLIATAVTTVGNNVSVGGDFAVAGNATTTGNQVISGNLSVHGAFSPDSFTFNPGSIFTVNGTSTFSTTSFLGDVNFNLKQIKNVVLEKFSNFPSSPVEGQMFWSTVTSTPYWYDATNARWRTQGNEATIVVAASNSKNKEKADYVCDGTDDQVQIQTAIDVVHALGGGVVQLLEGTYTFGISDKLGAENIWYNILLKDNVTLKGSGSGTILKATDTTISNSRFVILIHNSNNVAIKDLILDGNTANGVQVTILSVERSNKVIIENCHIINSYFSLIYLGGAKNVLIEGCYLEKLATPNYALGHTLDIDNPISAGTADNTEDVIIANNTIVVGDTDGTRTENCSRITYIGNSFTNTQGYKGVDIATNDTPPFVEDMKIIGNTFNNSNVDVGSVTGNVLITGNQLQGGFINIATLSSTTDVLVSNNMIRNSYTYGIYALNLLAGAKLSILGNHVSSCVNSGVKVSGSGTGTYIKVADNTISNSGADGIMFYLGTSRFDVFDNTIVSPTGYGIQLWTAILGNVRGNRIISPTSDGIYVRTASHKSNIIDNVIESAGGIGINIVASNDNIITNNRIDTPISYGLALNTSHYNVISENKILSASTRGMNIYGTYNRISKNYLQSIFGSGIYLDNGYNTVTDNDIIDVATGGTKILEANSGADYNYISGNRISGTGAGIIGRVGVNTKVARNIGYTTENSGTATIASGNTSITVSHGLSAQPATSTIAVVPTNNLGSATKFWVSNVGATTFRINTDVDPGVTTATFNWQIGSY